MIRMDPYSREGLRQRMLALGQQWPDEELDRLVPGLARNLPLIAALAAFPFGEQEPVVGFQMQMPPLFEAAGDAT